VSFWASIQSDTLASCWRIVSFFGFGITSEAMNEITSITATYQKKLVSAPTCLSQSATASAVLSFGLIMTGLVVISFYTGISGIVKAELFPTQVHDHHHTEAAEQQHVRLPADPVGEPAEEGLDRHVGSAGRRTCCCSAASVW
jgi:hypothetical protein